MKKIFLEIAQKYSLNLFYIEEKCFYRFSNDRRVFTIFQYYFDTNPSGVVQVCRDKEATSLVLTKYGIPNVIHKSFPMWGNSGSSRSSESYDFWEEIVKFSARFNFKVVCKPPLEANGKGIVFCSTKEDLFSIVSQFVARNEPICVSPFISATFEYRVFMLQGSPELVYKKVRPYMIGNGKDSVSILFLKHFSQFKNISIDYFDSGVFREDSIPEKGEIVTLIKQHNLSHGSKVDFSIHKRLKEKLYELAIEAVRVLDIPFSSVDILQDDDGNLEVIEVNPGIRTEILIGQKGSVGYEAAKKLYEKAIVAFFFNQLD